MERITSQKKIILEYLKNSKIHPSAEDVYTAVKKRLPCISKGTVYRNLKLLKEKGEILELYTKKNKRFDGDIRQHHHFICKKCDRIFDIFKPQLLDINKTRNKNRYRDIGEIQEYHIYLKGICKKCL